MEGKKYLETLLDSCNAVAWSFPESGVKELKGLPTVGGGYPCGKSVVVQGSLADGTKITVGHDQIDFWNMDTILNLSSKYKGPRDWYSVEVQTSHQAVPFSVRVGEDQRDWYNILRNLFSRASSQ